MTAIFFYGSLRDPGLLGVVLGRPVRGDVLAPAWAPGYQTRRLLRDAYPVLLPAPGERAEGALFRDPSPEDLARLRFFEEAEYDLSPLEIETDRGREAALYFRPTAKPKPGVGVWDFAAWTARDRAVAMLSAAELMTHFGRVPVEQIDTIWPGILIRARQSARAAQERPRLGQIRSRFGRDDVEMLAMTRSFTGFLAVQQHELRHRLYDGGWSAALSRSVVAWGDAVTILPYDPRADRLLMIEQFRPAPAARGDANPWCIEVVAGRIDSDDDAETTARREAREEAGVEIGRIEQIAAYYATPGLASEHMTAFVGEADLSAAGGTHGLVQEGENIRSILLSPQEAAAAVSDQAINTGPALVSVLWLLQHRDRLRAAWG